MYRTKWLITCICCLSFFSSCEDAKLKGEINRIQQELDMSRNYNKSLEEQILDLHSQVEVLSDERKLIEAELKGKEDWALRFIDTLNLTHAQVYENRDELSTKNMELSMELQKCQFELMYLKMELKSKN